MPMKGLLPIVFHNTKLLFNYAWLASVCLLAVILFVIEPSLTGPREMGRLGELVVSLIGLLLFPHLAFMEEGGIGEALFAKQVSHSWILFIRWMITVLLTTALISMLIVAIRMAGGTFSPIPLIGGVMITAVTLGTFGMLAARLSHSVSAGYIAAFAWYLLDWMTKGKLTGVFYLFGMAPGHWDMDKWWLAGLSILMAVICSRLSGNVK